MRRNNRAAIIDLFCGIGGLSYGLKKAGLPIIAGIDVDKKCQYAFEKNTKAKFINKPIEEITALGLHKYFQKYSVPILVGCAPCQPFSTHTNKYKHRVNSKKWFLINEFGRLINEVQPLIISMENVPNLSKREIFLEFVAKLKKEGYFVSYSNIYCPDYGIPQKRRRLVLLASKIGIIDIIPPTHSPEKYKTVRHAIGNLPPIKAGEVCKTDPLHRSSKLSEINVKRIKSSLPNGTWLDWDTNLQLSCHKKPTGKTYKAVYGRMSWEEPSSTITTQFNSLGTGRFGHPSQDRALSIREAAILQTFPEDYIFYRSEDEINFNTLCSQIGNAVPVELGYVIGVSIKKHLEDFDACR